MKLLPPRQAKRRQKHPNGRPSFYCEAFAEQSRQLCLLGYTDEGLAAFFDISQRTLNKWKLKHPGFVQSIAAGKARADAQVANALWHRALGSRGVPADVRAAEFWLRNRQPALWRDKHTLEHTGPAGGPIQVEDMSAAEIDRELIRLGALNSNGRIAE